MMRSCLRAFVCVCMAAGAACSRAPSEPIGTGGSSASPKGSPVSSGALDASGGHGAAGAGGSSSPPSSALVWDDPSRWKRKPPSNPTRTAEYAVPHAAGDAEDGECTVITFGPHQGGSVDDNIARWTRQFDAQKGEAARQTRQVNGMTVTRVDVAGTYHPMRMPGMAAPQAPAALPGYRLVGEIVSAPSGLWFFKLTGPDATVAAAEAEMDGMVDSARPR
jgi:hypothetical protein